MADNETEAAVIEGGGDTASRAAAPVKDTFDRGALEAKVGASLAALRGEEPDEVDAGAAEEVVEEKVDKAEAPAEETSAEETETEDQKKSSIIDPTEDEDDEDEEIEEVAKEQSPKEKAPAKDAKSKGPTLPGHLRRTLKAYEWSDADIDAHYGTDPMNFLNMAQKLHNTRSAETARWADIGRAARPKPDAVAESKKQASPHIDESTGLFKPLDIDSMVEKYGNEELVRSIAGPVQTIVQQINGILPDLLTGIASIRQARMETAEKQINGFFTGKELEAFAEVYGTDSSKLTDAQLEKRSKVLELADALIAGARSQGKNLSNDEALTMAHDTVGSEFKAQAIRKDLRKKVVKRSQGISLKPTKKGGTTEGGIAKNRSELEARTKGRLAAAFNN